MTQGRRKSERHIFLFEEMILFTKPRRRGSGIDWLDYKTSYKVYGACCQAFKQIMGTYRRVFQVQPLPKWIHFCCKSLRMHKNMTLKIIGIDFGGSLGRCLPIIEKRLCLHQLLLPTFYKSTPVPKISNPPMKNYFGYTSEANLYWFFYWAFCIIITVIS